MSKEVEQIIRHEHVSVQQPSEIKVCLIRGQRGSYGWEIQYSSPDAKRVLEIIEKLDRELRAKYIENGQ
ncbi:MAG: hypothetical protein B5M53_02545 [Candidatus Cloacimonas sp. 4484_209]|nr:MAG: hypothetical protein B5M53_02545 [Candidatus Cloacimonas sp. 4484_209]